MTLVVGLAGWGLLNARAEPLVRTATVSLPDWPSGMPPIKVVLLSDIHLGDAVMSRSRLERIVAQTNALQPDVIMLAGDYVVGHGSDGADARARELTAPLAGLRARIGVVAVLGNHDYWTSSASISGALSRAGIVVLDNEVWRAGPIAVAGVADAFSGHDDPERTWAAARQLSLPVVVLTHSPDISDDLPSDVRLVLAGHTHCGQVTLPWGGALFTRSPRARGKPLYDPKYRCGRVRALGRDVFVTAGVGAGSLPIRFGAAPDIWLLSLGETQRAPLPAESAKHP
jgi:predicted MPP superfamily phosphohydrolase